MLYLRGCVDMCMGVGMAFSPYTRAGRSDHTLYHHCLPACWVFWGHTLLFSQIHIILQFCGSKVLNGCPWAKIKVFTELCFFLKSPKKDFFLAFSGFWSSFYSLAGRSLPLSSKRGWDASHIESQLTLTSSVV